MEEEICQAGFPDPELNPDVIALRHSLFNKYVAPHLDMIHALCVKYTFDYEYLAENYNEVLVNFYRSIATYDPERSIQTWLHIVTKRHVLELERRRKRHDNKCHDVDVEEVCDTCEEGGFGTIQEITDISNYRDLYSDGLLTALEELSTIHRDALLLQDAGYSLKEIADIEHAKGTLDSRNIETLKSRLFFARNFLKKRLTKDGKRKIVQTDN
jgi:RNA polymerase sigma factor (sigma-70 family)